MGKPHTVDPELTQMLNQLWRANAAISSGSTAAAVRAERALLSIGGKVQGADHTTKARNSLNFLYRWMRANADKPTTAKADIDAARNVILDLENALKGL